MFGRCSLVTPPRYYYTNKSLGAMVLLLHLSNARLSMPGTPAALLFSSIWQRRLVAHNTSRLISGLALCPVLSTPPTPSPGSSQVGCLIAAIRAACMIGNSLALYDRHDYVPSLRPARSPSTSHHARRSLKLERRVCGLERELARQHRLS